MCCLTFLKSYSELEVLKGIFLSTGCISLGVLDTRKARKTFMYLSLFLLTLSKQHNDSGERYIYLFTSKVLRVRALFLQTCMTVVTFLICCSSWFDASTHKHKSTLLSTAPVWMAAYMAMIVSCCRAAKVPLPRNVGSLWRFCWSFPSPHTPVSQLFAWSKPRVQHVKSTGSLSWGCKELAMPASLFHLSIWGNLTWGCRELCNS